MVLRDVGKAFCGAFSASVNRSLSPEESITALSITFSSSRTLAGVIVCTVLLLGNDVVTAQESMVI
jgi:hypothetical protein